MSLGYRILAAALLLGFFACCVASAVLQLVAWNHVRPGEGPSLRGVWRPEAFLDPTGVRQMKLARWLLIVGAAAFVSHALVLRLGATLGGAE